MFSKKENSKLDKLQEGYTLKIKEIIWVITEIAEYDWGSNGRSIEYTITSKDKNENAFLEVEVIKGNYEVYFSKTAFIDHTVLKAAIDTKEIHYLGNVFLLEEDYKGAYKNLTNGGSWEKLESFMFYNKNEAILTIEDWGEHNFEAFYGEEIKAKNIKHINNF